MSDKIRPLTPLVKGGRAAAKRWRGDSCTQALYSRRFLLEESTLQQIPCCTSPYREIFGRGEVHCDKSPRHACGVALPPC